MRNLEERIASDSNEIKAALEAANAKIVKHGFAIRIEFIRETIISGHQREIGGMEYHIYQYRVNHETGALLQERQVWGGGTQGVVRYCVSEVRKILDTSVDTILQFFKD